MIIIVKIKPLGIAVSSAKTKLDRLEPSNRNTMTLIEIFIGIPLVKESPMKGFLYPPNIKGGIKQIPNSKDGYKSESFLMK